MARSTRESALLTPEPPQTDKKVRTTLQNDEDAKTLFYRRKMAHDAARWAYDQKKGSKAAVKSGYFGDPETVTRNMIEPLIRELKSNAGKFLDDRDHHNQVLTNSERVKLAQWILACADGQDPKDRVKVTLKVREMLRARNASNRWGEGAGERGPTPLHPGGPPLGGPSSSASSTRRFKVCRLATPSPIPSPSSHPSLPLPPLPSMPLRCHRAPSPPPLPIHTRSTPDPHLIHT